MVVQFEVWMVRCDRRAFLARSVPPLVRAFCKLIAMGWYHPCFSSSVLFMSKGFFCEDSILYSVWYQKSQASVFSSLLNSLCDSSVAYVLHFMSSTPRHSAWIHAGTRVGFDHLFRSKPSSWRWNVNDLAYEVDGGAMLLWRRPFIPVLSVAMPYIFSARPATFSPSLSCCLSTSPRVTPFSNCSVPSVQPISSCISYPGCCYPPSSWWKCPPLQSRTLRSRSSSRLTR
jgi:hypothetical protein